MRRRNFFRLAGAGLLSTGLGCGKPNAAGEDNFRFVHLTDIHVQPEANAEQGFLKAIQAVNSLDPAPDFVITGGDLVFDAMDVSFERADMLFKLYERCVAELDCPVHHVIGNHDILGWREKSGVSPDHPEYGKKIFAGRLGGGSTWKSFYHKGWHFVLLDSIERDDHPRGYFGKVNDGQLAWLKQDLASVAAGTPIVVATHIPLMSIVEQERSGANAPLPDFLGITNSMEVLRLFDGHNLSLVLQGHLHRDEQLRLDGRRFCMSGAVCGGWWKGPHDGTEEGFGVIDVINGKARFSYVDYGWEVG